MPLDQLRGADAATWLDRELASSDPTPIRDAGFGCEVRITLAARRQWLVEQQLADGEGDGIRSRANALAMLQRRELLRVAGRLSEEFDGAFVETKPGDQVEGRLTRSIEMTSGRFALIEKSREFTLAPWRPVLEKQLGNQVAGIMRADGINWRFGRSRSRPEIS